MEGVTLKAGMVISNLEPADVCDANNEKEADDSEAIDAVLMEMIDRIDTSVSPEHKEQL